METIEWSDLKEHHVYSSGNHEGLEKFISIHTIYFISLSHLLFHKHSDGIHEVETIEWSDLKVHHVYSNHVFSIGNHEGLEKFISIHNSYCKSLSCFFISSYTTKGTKKSTRPLIITSEI